MAARGAIPIPADPRELPPLINIATLCALLEISRATLLRRQREGLLPPPVGGLGGDLFRRDDILGNLGLTNDGSRKPPSFAQAWASNPQTYEVALARVIRRSKGSGRRAGGRVLFGSRTP